MARRLTTTDGYAFINAMADEMLGKNATIQAIDESSFASVGESILQVGTENVINTLSLVASRNLIAIRPYQAKFRLINALYGNFFKESEHRLYVNLGRRKQSFAKAHSRKLGHTHNIRVFVENVTSHIIDSPVEARIALLGVGCEAGYMLAGSPYYGNILLTFSILSNSLCFNIFFFPTMSTFLFVKLLNTL